jgi:threonine dehydratase
VSAPAFDKIGLAFERINPAFLDMPAFEAASPIDLPVTRVVFKDERQNPIRSFKGRGSDFLVQGLARGSHIVCASVGNFGQGMAVAAQRHGCTVTVFAAETAVRCKLDRMAHFGAAVRLAGKDFDESKQYARDYARSAGALFIEDGAHAEIAEGAGTIGLELSRDFGDFDAVLVPLGNGALAAGMGCWFKTAQPRTKIVAVAAAGAPAMGYAVVGISNPERADLRTIADGIAVRVPIPSAVEAVSQVVDQVIFVADELIARAVRFLEKATGEAVEPAGAAGLAGLLHDSAQWSGARVAIPICGGNRDEGALDGFPEGGTAS